MKLYGEKSYFTTREFECDCGCGFGSREEDISEKLIRYLNEMRSLLNRPMIVTSGARCEDYNTIVGGKPNSAHLANLVTGQSEAADIAANGNHERYELVKLAIYCGFRRIGIGEDFVHFDVADHLPGEIIWLY